MEKALPSEAVCVARDVEVIEGLTKFILFKFIRLCHP
jgi:hypothetical protein